jgi:hypothetical protein
MNEEQIILSLIAFYKKEGIDLHQVLDDPMFNALPIFERVKLIKQHAKMIHDGIDPRLTKTEFRDARNDILLKGLGSGFAGYQAGKAVQALFGPQGVRRNAVLAGATTGLVFGGGYAAVKAYEQRKEKKRMINQFADLSRHPTDDTAVQTLALRGLQRRSPGSGLAKKLIDMVETHVEPAALNRNVEREVSRYNARTQKD